MLAQKSVESPFILITKQLKRWFVYPVFGVIRMRKKALLVIFIHDLNVSLNKVDLSKLDEEYLSSAILLSNFSR